MRILYATENPQKVVGVDIKCTDGGTQEAPESTQLTKEEAHEWFTNHPNASSAAVRLLTLKETATRAPPQQSELPFTQKTVSHAIWSPEVYLHLTQNRGGGCAALLDEPWRFILQTPSDGGPFCALAMSRHGTVAKGIYIFSASIFEPKAIMKDEVVQSGWRGSGLQLICLPQAIAKAHAVYISTMLTRLVEEVAFFERSLLSQTTVPIDGFASWTSSLQNCSALLIDVERRARFQTQIFTAIEDTSAASRHGSVPWPPLAALKSQRESWSADFESLPRRIDNARGVISSLIQQRNEQLNLEIAESSRRMAEAALRESASMKTIAILTMIFLPTTAVASFFSMSMFNWNAESGSALASSWIWIFFVIAVPLTAGVVYVWYTITKRNERALAAQLQPARPASSRYRDGERTQSSSSETMVEGDDIEMQTFQPITKPAE